MRAPAAARFVAAFAALVASIACGGGTTPTEPTAPAPVYELKTSTFPGTLTTGGAAGFPFTVVNPGDINLTITELAPVSTLTMGLALGSWDAAASTCTQQISTSTATINVAYAATPSAPGEYCVGIFDIGNVQVSTNFVLKVTYY
jgi:hypothetical protein